MRLLALVAVIPVVAAVPAYSQKWVPDAATIKELESSIKPGDIPHWGNMRPPVLADYIRYYAGVTLKGERMILAEFVASYISDTKTAVHIVHDRSDFPVIDDGSCGIVNIVYSVKSHKVISLVCNGRA